VTFVNDQVLKATNQTIVDTLLQTVDWELWVKQPGYPPVQLDFSNPDQEEATNLADDYINRQGLSSPSNYADYNKFYANQKVIFLL
jgi:hypothetical protein